MELTPSKKEKSGLAHYHFAAARRPNARVPLCLNAQVEAHSEAIERRSSPGVRAAFFDRFEVRRDGFLHDAVAVRGSPALDYGVYRFSVFHHSLKAGFRERTLASRSQTSAAAWPRT